MTALEPVTVKMPARDLSEGRHEVTGRLVTAGGDVIFSKTITLRKLPANPNTVRLREDGIWLRHGKPYLPVDYFGLSVRQQGPKDCRAGPYTGRQRRPDLPSLAR